MSAQSLLGAQVSRLVRSIMLGQCTSDFDVRFIYFFKKYFYLFIYFWLCWVFIATCGLSLVVASGSYSSLRCTGFSLQWLLLLQSTGSRHAGFGSCGSRALEHRLNSCGTRASFLCGMWDLPRPGFKPVSSALAGGFFFFLI